MKKSVTGYTGVFKQYIENPYSYGPTIFCGRDMDRETLVMVLLTPESFADAYRTCSQITYQKIYFVVPSMDVLFISGVFNLVSLIKNIKPYARWIFPETPALPTSIDFESRQIIEKLYSITDTDEMSGTDTLFTIEYVDAGVPNRSLKVYDIIFRCNEVNIYFCQYLTPEKLEKLYNDKSIDEIHIAYASTLYGGLTYYQATNIDFKYHNKLYIHSFTSIAEYEECVNTIRQRIRRCNYGDFV